METSGPTCRAMMETPTSHRPWEADRPNASMMHNHNQQTLPSISTLTAGIDQPPTEKGQLNLSMSSIQRDSGSWSGPSSTSKSPQSWWKALRRKKLTILTQQTPAQPRTRAVPRLFQIHHPTTTRARRIRPTSLLGLVRQALSRLPDLCQLPKTNNFHL